MAVAAGLLFAPFGGLTERTGATTKSLSWFPPNALLLTSAISSALLPGARVRPSEVWLNWMKLFWMLTRVRLLTNRPGTGSLRSPGTADVFVEVEGAAQGEI
jgi:hypothetical protein